jgi:uncharacterized protein (TIGR03790 family)
VLVVYNSSVPASVKLAKYYAERRGIPAGNLCAISPPSTTSLLWPQYVASVKAPIQKCLNTVGPQNILYIVFSFQTPFIVKSSNGRSFYAVDQYVADIWDQYAAQDPDPMPGKFHPYYDDAQSQGNVYQPFVSLAAYRAQPDALKIHSVWRLDGATAELAQGLVDKAMAAEASGLKGNACFDRNRGPIANVVDVGYGEGDWDLRKAATFAEMAGFKVIEDSNSAEFGTPPVPDCPNAAIYAGWYSLNHYNDAFTWNTGAIGFHLDSASALNPREGPNWAANAILKGITVTSGAVTEPYLAGLIRPGGTFRDLFQGANVGDAVLRNTRWLKWMIINLGDPLYRPFPNGLAPFNPPAPQASLAIASRHLLNGDATAARITLEKPAPPGGTIIKLISNMPKLVAVPESVVVPAGTTVALFPITTVTTPSVSADTTATITASGVGQNVVMVSPLLARLVVTPTSILSGTPATGSVLIRASAKAGGESVALKSDNPSVVVTEAVVVPRGANQATFTVRTAAVASATTASITATLNGATVKATISLQPPRGATGVR